MRQKNVSGIVVVPVTPVKTSCLMWMGRVKNGDLGGRTTPESANSGRQVRKKEIPFIFEAKHRSEE